MKSKKGKCAGIQNARAQGNNVSRGFFARFFGHLRTVGKHRALVRKHCFKLGLYWQGLTHDLSKYSPTEFWTGVKYYQGDKSPNFIERKANNGYSYAWLHHKGRNKHHLEYWIDYDLSDGATMMGLEMPPRYLAEMFCDRVAASKTYRGSAYKDSDPYDYLMLVKDHYIIHPKTLSELEKIMTILKDEGEEAAFNYIRKEILKK